MQNDIDWLVHRAKSRDPDAFTELMKVYTKDMYRVAISILMNDEDAADAIQETILTCWEKIEMLCTVQYTDGTTSDARITIGGGISTPEIGVTEKDVPYADFEFRLE